MILSSILIIFYLLVGSGMLRALVTVKGPVLTGAEKTLALLMSLFWPLIVLYVGFLGLVSSKQKIKDFLKR